MLLNTTYAWDPWWYVRYSSQIQSMVACWLIKSILPRRKSSASNSLGRRRQLRLQRKQKFWTRAPSEELRCSSWLCIHLTLINHSAQPIHRNLHNSSCSRLAVLKLCKCKCLRNVYTSVGYRCKVVTSGTLINFCVDAFAVKVKNKYSC